MRCVDFAHSRISWSRTRISRGTSRLSRGRGTRESMVEGFTRRNPSWPLASDPSSFGRGQSPSPTLIESWRSWPRPSGNRLVDGASAICTADRIGRARRDRDTSELGPDGLWSASGECITKHRIYSASVASVYPLYIAKAGEEGAHKSRGQ